MCLLRRTCPQDNHRLSTIARTTSPRTTATLRKYLATGAPAQASSVVRSANTPSTILPEHRRSVAFLESHGDTWSCFLVTVPEVGGTWHGYFSFRPSHGEVGDDEVRTANIFIEDSEAAIYEKARSLGRPLLAGLLDSALYTAAGDGGNPRLRGRFRSLLRQSAVEIAGDWSGERPRRVEGQAEAKELDRLRSLYASYRLDQVAHFICLVELRAFEHAVDTILHGESVDFLARDRMQYAMMVVDHIERLLPLPDFQTWAEDFLAKPETYRLYTHTLHREGRLP